jgi:hypothetical protein
VASLLAAVFAAAAWAAPALAQLPGQPAVQLDFPVVSPGIPAYARLELLIPNFDVPNDRHWAAIVFYRDPACVPPDFDLGRFFHLPGPAGLGAFACKLTVEGTEIWERGQAQGDQAPIYVRTRNATPHMPVWFVAWHELKPLLDRGQIYIGEIENLRSLVKGHARWFEEALYPNGTAVVPGITMRAEGRLESGGAFSLDWHFAAGTPEEVSIRLDLPSRHPRPSLCEVWPQLCN